VEITGEGSLEEWIVQEKGGEKTKLGTAASSKKVFGELSSRPETCNEGGETGVGEKIFPRKGS